MRFMPAAEPTPSDADQIEQAPADLDRQRVQEVAAQPTVQPAAQAAVLPVGQAEPTQLELPAHQSASTTAGQAKAPDSNGGPLDDTGDTKSNATWEAIDAGEISAARREISNDHKWLDVKSAFRKFEQF